MLVGMGLILTVPSFLSTAAAAPPTSALDFDLTAVVLTTSDLEGEGFDGYRIENAFQWDLEEDALYISDSQKLTSVK